MKHSKIHRMHNYMLKLAMQIEHNPSKTIYMFRGAKIKTILDACSVDMMPFLKKSRSFYRQIKWFM